MKQSYRLDEIDRRIIRALQQDAQLGQAELSAKAGASSASCWRRVKALEAENILGPCVRLVDATKIDRGVTVMTQVRLKSRVGDQPTKFVNFVMLRTEIMECYSMAGDWDYQLRVVAADITDYERFLQELLRHPSVASVSSQFALKQVKYTTAIPV